MMGKYSKPTFANENLDSIKIIQNLQNRYQVLQMILTFANEYGKVPQITTNQCKKKFKLSKNQLGYANKLQPLQVKYWFYKSYPSFSNHDQVILQMVFNL
jgi:hypothetical protein